MRRALFVIATATLATALFAGGALAKGVTGNAKVEGKGLKKAITFNGDSHEDDGFMAFLGQTGVMGSFDGSSTSDWKDEPPTKTWGRATPLPGTSSSSRARPSTSSSTSIRMRKTDRSSTR